MAGTRRQRAAAAIARFACCQPRSDPVVIVCLRLDRVAIVVLYQCSLRPAFIDLTVGARRLAALTSINMCRIPLGDPAALPVRDREGTPRSCRTDPASARSAAPRSSTPRSRP